jgi:hypothetical protein
MVGGSMIRVFMRNRVKTRRRAIKIRGERSGERKRTEESEGRESDAALSTAGVR